MVEGPLHQHTPGPYELKKCGGEVVEQIIRPTGLVDPEIEVVAARGQVPDLLRRIQERAAAGERVLVTTLTKRLAEDLSSYIQQAGLRGRYCTARSTRWSGLKSCAVARGKFDVLVGVNLLRGLGSARGVISGDHGRGQGGVPARETSLIQTIGRCARM